MYSTLEKITSVSIKKCVQYTRKDYIGQYKEICTVHSKRLHRSVQRNMYSTLEKITSVSIKKMCTVHSKRLHRSVLRNMYSTLEMYAP